MATRPLRTSIDDPVEEIARRLLAALEADEAQGRLGIRVESGRIGAWTYELTLEPQAGRWVVSQLSVRPTSRVSSNDRPRNPARGPVAPHGGALPAGGLTARHLRAIRFRTEPSRPHDGLLRAAGKIAAHYERSGDTHERLARVAAVYVDCLRAGSRRPNADCAGRIGMPAHRVRDALHQARTRGLLTRSSGQGIPGGELTQKCLDILRLREALRTGAQTETSGLPSQWRTKKSTRVTTSRSRS